RIRAAGHLREGVPEKERDDHGADQPEPDIRDPPPSTEKPAEDPRRFVLLIVLLALIVVMHRQILPTPKPYRLMRLRQTRKGPGFRRGLREPEPTSSTRSETFLPAPSLRQCEVLSDVLELLQRQARRGRGL